jgi:hypothetical protein
MRSGRAAVRPDLLGIVSTQNRWATKVPAANVDELIE